MHRCANVCTEAGAGAEIVDGNRELANLLSAAADRIEELEASWWPPARAGGEAAGDE
jgi:hypothetical protein